jgi:hypothetical protein
MAHGPIRGRAPDLGTVATVDHHGGRAGTPGATHLVAGRWVLPSRRGSGRWCATSRRPPVGQAVSRPASGWPRGRPWPRCPGRLPPRRSRSTSCGWPARARRRWAAAGPRGMARHWPTSAARQGSWRGSPPPPCGGCWPALTSSPGALSAGSLPRALHASPATRVPCLRMRASCPWLSTPPCRLSRVALRRGPRHQGTCRAARHRQTSAAGRCMSGRPLRPARDPSLGTVPPVRVSRKAAPFGHRGRRPWGIISGRFIACAIMSAPSTVKPSAHGGCNLHALSAMARLSTAHGCIRWHRGAASSNAHACVSRMWPRQRTSKRRSNRACVHGLRPRIPSTGRRHPWRRVWPRSLPWPPHMGYSIGVHLSERQR